jgi:hypothetical protein
MDLIDEGSNGRIYSLTNGNIQKIVKRGASGHDVITQKRIHRLCRQFAAEVNGKIFVPALITGLTQEDYCMERIDTTDPVSLVEDIPLLLEFISLWKMLWYYGFALLDFELYRQPDGRVALIDFDKTCFRQTNDQECIITFTFTLDPLKRTNDYFFSYPCFPPHFLDYLVGNEGERFEKYSRLSALPYRG